VGKNVAVFVDVANIFYAAKAAGVDIDYVTLLKSATAGRDFVRAYAYTGLDPDNENQRNFHSFLARHSYKVVSKDIRKYGDGKVKANLDIELVVDLMKTARNLDVAVVISGDGDFAPAIRAVQEMGVRVEVISFRGNTSSDLIEVADLFTDITQIARVEKGSSRSGRRVAGDDEDLSMTEVPDKQTEGSGRGRTRGGRGRTRSGETMPVAAEAPSRSRGRRSTAKAPAEAEPVSAGAATGRLVALPGEKLSKAAADRLAAEEAGIKPVAIPEEAKEAEEAAAIAITGDDESTGEDGPRRRRRRRGGRGRGRGRGVDGPLLEGAVAAGAIETLYAEDIETSEMADQTELAATLEPEPVAPRRSPRAATFGSVWDAQIGMPSAPTGDLGPASEDEDLEEPEIPEYLIAEQRRGASSASGASGGRGGRGGGRSGGRGGRSAYVTAMERERFGGRGGGGLNRYPDVSGRTTGRQEPARRSERGGGRGAGGVRPAAAARPSGGDPWTEVPPELEEMLRAQLAAKSGGPQATRDAAEATTAAGEGASGEAATEAAKPKRRTTRKPAASAD